MWNILENIWVFSISGNAFDCNHQCYDFFPDEVEENAETHESDRLWEVPGKNSSVKETYMVETSSLSHFQSKKRKRKIWRQCLILCDDFKTKSKSSTIYLVRSYFLVIDDVSDDVACLQRENWSNYCQFGSPLFLSFPHLCPIFMLLSFIP